MMIYHQVSFILLNQFQHFAYQHLHFLLEQGLIQIRSIIIINLFFSSPDDFKVVMMNLNDDTLTEMF